MPGRSPRPNGWRLARLLLLMQAVSLGVALMLWPPRHAEAEGPLEVDLALVLAVDCSYSVDSNEFRLQMQGLAKAFRQPAIHNAIAEGEMGRIAVVLVQWSDDRNQLVAIPWTVIAAKEHAERFAAMIDRTPRNLAEGGTAIGTALQYSAAVALAAPVLPKRRVIDLSADGRNNRGLRPSMARDEIVARGITINGLAITNEWPTLDKYFEHQIVGGPSNFVVVANDYEAYAEAIYRKLLKEITGPGVS